jgi:hypothetical protein
MKDILDEEELRFLARQGLGPDDVFDARGMPQLVLDATHQRGK